jgi:hypothetical protein
LCQILLKPQRKTLWSKTNDLKNPNFKLISILYRTVS